MCRGVDIIVVLSSSGISQTEQNNFPLGGQSSGLSGCFNHWVGLGQLRSLRCNSIKGSLRVALVNSSLLNMDLYTGGSPMSIQILTMRTGVLYAKGGP